MEAQQVIEKLGGTIAAARILGVKPPSVSEWKKNNSIPALRIFQLRVLRPDLFSPSTTSGTPALVQAPAVDDQRSLAADGRAAEEVGA